jgi:hypothetical protein
MPGAHGKEHGFSPARTRSNHKPRRVGDVVLVVEVVVRLEVVVWLVVVGFVVVAVVAIRAVMVATDRGKRPNIEPDGTSTSAAGPSAWMRRSDRLLHPYPLAECVRS